MRGCEANGEGSVGCSLVLAAPMFCEVGSRGGWCRRGCRAGLEVTDRADRDDGDGSRGRKLEGTEGRELRIACL